MKQHAIMFAEWLTVNAQPIFPNKNEWCFKGHPLMRFSTDEMYEIFLQSLPDE